MKEEIIEIKKAIKREMQTREEKDEIILQTLEGLSGSLHSTLTNFMNQNQ